MAPETSTRVGGASIETSTWCQMIQVPLNLYSVGLFLVTCFLT